MVKRRWAAGVAFVLSACGAVPKPPDPDRTLDVRVTGSVFESDRGYRLAALPEAGSKVLRLDVRYPVGAADDPPGKEGLAHLVEHLLFDIELTRNGHKTSVSAELGRLALAYNAYTHADYTSYEVIAVPEALEELLALEAERLSTGCAGLTREGFARTREIVLNELRAREGATGAELARQVREAVYPPGHPYRRVDSVDTVSRLVLDDVCGFLVGPYRRGNALVIASGAVDGPALQAAARHLGRAPKRAPPPAIAIDPAPWQPGTIRLRAEIDEPELLITWPLPPMATRAYRLVQMAAPAIEHHLLGFAFLYEWGHSASSWILGGAHAPILVVGVKLSSTKELDEAIGSAGKASLAAAHGVAGPGDRRGDPAWVLRWHSEVEDLVARWASLAGRSAMLGDYLQLESGTDVLVGRVQELAAADPQEVRELAEKWLDISNARRILIEPSGATSTLRGGALAISPASAAHDHATPVDGALADRPLALPASDSARRVERYTASNGLRVILWPHGNAPLAHVRLVIDSGAAHEPGGREGLSVFVGADERGPDALVFATRRLSAYADIAVSRIGGRLRTPTYALADETKSYLKARLKHRRARERAAYDRELAVARYGSGHPYARGSMSETSIDELSRDVVTGWARDHLVPKNATLIVAGRFDPALIRHHIAYNTEHVSSGADSPDPEAVPRPRRSWISGITAKPTPVVEVQTSFVRGSGIDRDQAKRRVLVHVLDAQLSKLRRTQAVTYGFSSSYEPRRAGGLWTIGGDVDAARAAEATTSFEQILDRIRSDPETYRGDFVLARQKVLVGLLAGSTSARAVAEQLEFLARFDLPDEHYATLARDVAALTLPDFHRFVAQELAADGEVFGAFGNEEPVQLAIRASKAVTQTARRSPEPAR